MDKIKEKQREDAMAVLQQKLVRAIGITPRLLTNEDIKMAFIAALAVYG